MKKILYIVTTDYSNTNNGKDYMPEDYPRVFSTLKKAKEYISNTIQFYDEKSISENDCKEYGYTIITRFQHTYMRRRIFSETLNEK